MTEVRLYGHLRDSFTDKIFFRVSSFPEIIRALNANFPTFTSEMIKDNRQYKVLIDNSHLVSDNISLTPIGESSIVKIVPVLEGAGEGKDPLGQILLGAVIVGVVIASGGAAAVGVQGFLSNMAMGVGYSLIAGGITALMQEDQDEIADNSSTMFSGPVNVTKQGAPVPVGYGRMRIGSVVVSAAIDIDQGILAPLKYIEVNGSPELVVVGTLHVKPAE